MNIRVQMVFEERHFYFGVVLIVYFLHAEKKKLVDPTQEWKVDPSAISRSVVI